MAWQYLSDNQPDQHTSSHTSHSQNHVKMKMKALKPLGEEKPATIDDTKFSDTLVDVPLPDSEPKTESKTKTKTKTKTALARATPAAVRRPGTEALRKHGPGA